MLILEKKKILNSIMSPWVLRNLSILDGTQLKKWSGDSTNFWTFLLWKFLLCGTLPWKLYPLWPSWTPSSICSAQGDQEALPAFSFPYVVIGNSCWGNHRDHYCFSPLRDDCAVGYPMSENCSLLYFICFFKKEF